jgi:hypothetical protein
VFGITDGDPPTIEPHDNINTDTAFMIDSAPPGGYNTTVAGLPDSEPEPKPDDSSNAGGKPSLSVSSGSPSLSAGAKAGIGVGVAVLATITIVLVFLCLRRRRNKPQSKAELASEEPIKAQTFGKAELTGGAFDKESAGPVREKPEMTVVESRSTYLTLPELSSMGTERTELTSRVSMSKDRSAAPLASAATVQKRSAPETTHKDTNTRRELQELVSEVDTLVSDLGVITKRKRALQESAEASGMRPEDVQGRKGDEYRELLGREQRVRARMEEVDGERRRLEGTQ